MFVAPPILSEIVPAFVKHDAGIRELDTSLGGRFLEALRLKDALSYLAKIRAHKASVHHGSADKSVPLSMGQKWFETLNQATNIDEKTMPKYPDCEHYVPQYRMFSMKSPLEK